MTESAEQFFPPRGERGELQYVYEDFPFPLALTYSRLHEEMDRQEPVAAAWQLRDAYECLLKFSASLAVADLLRAKPNHEAAGKVAGLLLKRTGLSVGDWHSLLVNALNPPEELVVDEALFRSGRLLPELLDVFFKVEPSGLLEANELNFDIAGRERSADGTPNSFVSWRNDRFGHGVFRVDRTVYVEETLSWLEKSHKFYEALRPVLDTRRLVSDTPGGEELVWRGTQHLPLPPPHEHEPSGELVPMFLAPRSGEAGARLSLSPFLSVQPCDWCGQPTAFFFDKFEFVNKNKMSHKTHCLEYFGGHLYPRRDWQPVGELAERVPEKFKHVRDSYDQEEVAEGPRRVFRNFEQEYLRPDYLFDAFWGVLGEKQKGYLHLVGEGGTGKTYFVRGLEAEGVDRGTPVLTYHVLPGARTDYRTFVSQLADRARERLNFRTQEPQTNVDSHAELQDQLVQFLKELMRANGCNKLVVALDAIDELPDPAPNSAAITDFLPPPEKLPRGCFVLLTSRGRLRPKIEEDLERIRGDGGLYTPITLSPEDPNNRSLVAAYVTGYFERLIEEGQLPEDYRSEEYVGAVLERSGGIFLYARHLAAALASGAFAEPGALPEAHEFYPAYLQRLRERVGGEYEVYLDTLLLLSAAQEPVTLEQPHRWGVRPGRLQWALYDIADFLREHRGRSWHDSLSDEGENRYELAHEAFVRYVQEDPGLSEGYLKAHARIAQAALTAHHASGWTGADPTEEGDLYDLRHTLTHLREAGDTEAEEALLADEGYASACWNAGNLAQERARYRIAVDLSDRAFRVYRYLVEVKRREELANDLARTLDSRGNALGEQGKLAEAVRDSTEAIRIRRYLVEVNWRKELANDLALALNSRGISLSQQGKLAEAVRDYTEAVGIYRHLVEGLNQEELVNDLARTLNNMGNALWQQGKPAEAVRDFTEAIRIRRHLVEERPELTKDLAKTLSNRGNALGVQGRLAEAVRDYTEAVGIYRDLVEVKERKELADELASVLGNRGAALRQQGKSFEALGDYTEVVGIYRRLVETEKRKELANYLAKTLNNKSIALQVQHELDEAVEDLGEAVGIYRHLVEERPELANELAGTLNSRGNTLVNQGEPAEAVGDYTEAIGIYKPLAEERPELANDLAGTLRNKALALKSVEQWPEAMDCYGEAIRWWEFCIRAGMWHLTPEVLLTIRARMMTLLDLKRWDEAAADVKRILHHALPFLQEEAVRDVVREGVVGEVRVLVGVLRKLASEDREQLYAGLGEWAEVVRGLVEGQ